jgi:hypothetical protein
VAAAVGPVDFVLFAVKLWDTEVLGIASKTARFFLDFATELGKRAGGCSSLFACGCSKRGAGAEAENLHPLHLLKVGWCKVAR